MTIYVSRVLDRQLLNVWLPKLQGIHTCSRTRSHDSVIFFVFLEKKNSSSYGEFKAKMQAISSDTHQLQLFKPHHFKLEIFKSI